MNKKVRIILIGVIVFIALILVRYFMPHSVTTVSNKDLIKNRVNFNYTSIKQTNKASALVNLDTNQVIYQNNISQPQPVYSVSKTMFLATVAKEMKKNNISYDKEVKVIDIIDKVNKQANFSKANLKSDNYYTIKELFDATMIPSGNDAAILLGYEIFGSHAKAVDQMNSNAKAWGLNDSSFVSTSGLDGKYLSKLGIKAQDGKNMMSVKDAIKLTKLVIKEYPEIVDSGSKQYSVIGGRSNSAKIELESVNKLIDGLSNGYQGVYGLKTGSNIEKFSDCIIALKKGENNQTLAAISFGSKTREYLYDDISNLYDYLKEIEQVNLKDGIELNADVGFAKNKVGLGTKKNFYLYVPKGQTFEYSLNPNKTYNKHLNSFYGVDKGDVLGELAIENVEEFYGGEVAGKIEVVVKDKVEQKSIIGKIGELVNDLINK